MFSKKLIILCLFLIVGGLICAGTASADSIIYGYEYGAPVTDPVTLDLLKVIRGEVNHSDGKLNLEDIIDYNDPRSVHLVDGGKKPAFFKMNFKDSKNKVLKKC